MSSLSLCHFPLHILCLLLAIRCMFHLCDVWTNSCTFEPTWVSKGIFSVFCDDFGVVVGSKRENSEREVANWQRVIAYWSLYWKMSLQRVSTWNLILTFCRPMCVHQCRWYLMYLWAHGSVSFYRFCVCVAISRLVSL
jgi:hypothetical protein